MRVSWVRVAVLFTLLASVVFSGFIVSGRPPFPGDFLQAWYEPWRSLHYEGGRVLLPNKPVGEDAFRHVVPFKLLAVQAFRQFRLPLWNPYNGAGQPLLATLNSGFFDPFNAFFFMLPAGVADGITVMAQFILIALSLFAYTRTIGLGTAASVLGALAYALSGFVAVRLVFLSYGFAMMALPLILTVIERTARGNPKYLLTVPVITAVLIVSAQTQIVIYILSVAVLYGLFRLAMRPQGRRGGRRFAWLLFFVILGAGISAVQVFPTYELMKLSHIVPGNSFDVILKFLVPVRQLIGIPVPNYFGNSATYNYWGQGDSVQTAAAMGILPLFLAGIAVFGFRRSRKAAWFFLGVAALSAVLGIDWALTRWFYRLPLPVISTGAPARIFFLTTFAVSVLSAFGMERLLKEKIGTVRFAALTAVTLLGMGVLAVVTRQALTAGAECPEFLPDNCRITAWRNLLLAYGVFLPQLAIAGVLALSRGAVRGAAVILLCLSVSAAGVYNTRKSLSVSPTPDLYPELPVTSALRKYTADARIFGIGDAMIEADLASVLGIYDPQYYHPLYVYRYRELLEYANNGTHAPAYPRGDASIKKYYRDNPNLIFRRDRLLNLLSAKYRLFKKEELAGDDPGGATVWQDGTWLLTSSGSALPRAYIASRVRAASDPETLLGILFDPSFDYRNSVVSEADIPGVRPESSGSATVTAYTPERVRFRTRTSGPALAVLTDTHYPGWIADVDGQPVPVYRVNYALRAVPVPQGDHTVTYTYRPASVRAGMLVTFVSVSVLLLLTVRYRRLFA